VTSGAGAGGPLSGCAFGAGVRLDAPLPPSLTEASGVAASGQYPGRLYTHNDGKAGGGALYALDGNNNSGVVLGVYRLRGDGGGGGGGKRGDSVSGAPSVTSRKSDWEDCAVAREPLPPRRWKVFVGDIGNNEGKRRTVTVYRFEEPPPAPPGAGGDDLFIDLFDTISLEYPEAAAGGGDEKDEKDADTDGRYPDSETLMVDPVRGDIFLITKEREKKARGTTRARVYRATYPFRAHAKNRLELVGRLGFPTGELVGGDIAHNGEELLLKTRGYILTLSPLALCPKPKSLNLEP